MVFLNSFYILLFLFALGLPLSLFCYRRSLGYAYLVLAPHLGLVCLTILVANAYLLNIPVAKTVVPIAGLTLLALTYGSWRLWRHRVEHSNAPPFRLGALLIPLILGILAIVIYGLPFIFNPELEYHAYAGTDGSAYITTSEYLMNHGLRDAPAPDFYHPFSGLIRAFTSPTAVQKPGTFADLAFFSALLHRLPHELFSSLMLLAGVLLFTSCYALARSLDYGPVSAGFAAFLAALCPSLLGLTSNTYLGASLTLPLMPLILLLAEDAVENRSAAVLIALTYSAYWLISADSWLIPVTFAGPYLLYSIWKCMRLDRRKVLISLALFGVALIAACAVPSHFVKTLAVLGFAFLPRNEMTADAQAWSWALFWHTIGLGDIMGSPAYVLGALGRLALWCTGLTGLVYLFLGFMRRRFSVLFFAYLALWIVVLIGGVMGRFQNLVVLGRVSEQIAFLHPLVYVALLTEITASFSAWPAQMRWPKPILAAGAFAILLFLCLYPARPFFNFERESLFTNRQRTNQFDRSAFKDRVRMAKAVEAQPVLLFPAPSDPTGTLHIAALFSNIQLLVAPQFVKYFLLNGRKLPDDYYCAKSVLIPELYTDIVDLSQASTVFRGAGYHLVRNDLVPILDDETFPIKNAFDIYFLKKYSLVEERTLVGATAVHVCSATPRSVRIEVRYVAPPHEQQVAIKVSPSNATSMLALGPQGRASTAGLALSKGQNRIDISRAAGSEPVEIRGFSIVDNR